MVIDAVPPAVVLIVAALALSGLLYTAVRAWAVHRRGLEHLATGAEQSEDMVQTPHAGWLRRWLVLAGYRSPTAALLFGAASAAAIAVGAAFAVAFRVTVLEQMIRTVADIPGGVGDAFAAILAVGHWILFVIVAMGPVLVVRAARRRRVREAEQDLPLALELFATLAEAGLGFDSALARIVQSQPVERPLTQEFIGFQRDTRAGVARVTALKHLAERLDVMAVTIFVSAIIQAEQVGASLAETLRHQADDLRERRREQALLQAQALPVKLVFPLVSCFLPGIFLSTLGPVLYQMIQIADSVLRPVRR